MGVTLFKCICLFMLTTMVAVLDAEPIIFPWKEVNAGLWREINMPEGVKPTFACYNQGVYHIMANAQGIWTSRDECRTWEKDALWSESKNYEINAVSVCGSVVYIGSRGGLIKSDDSGKSWKPMGLNKELRYTMVTELGASLFFATDKGIYESRDQGKTLLQTSAPLDTYPQIITVGETLYALHLKADNKSDLLVSKDKGQSWINATTTEFYASPSSISNLKPWSIAAFQDTAGMCIGASFYFTNNNGQRWSHVPAGSQATYSCIGDGGTLYFSTTKFRISAKVKGKSKIEIVDPSPGFQGRWVVQGLNLPAEVVPPDHLYNADDARIFYMRQYNKALDPKLEWYSVGNKDSVNDIIAGKNVLLTVSTNGKVYLYPIAAIDRSTMLPAQTPAEDALIARVQLAQKENKPEKLPGLVEELQNSNPWNPNMLYLRAYIKLGQNKFREALNDLNQLIVLQPNATESYYLRGICHQNLDHPRAAVQDFSTVIYEKSANKPAALTYRGMLYHYLGNVESARSDLNEAAKLGVKEAQIYLDTKMPK